VKNPTLCAAVFALAAAVPVGAQTTDEALPPPEVSERAKQLLDADKDATKKKPRSFLIMPQAMSGTIRGERDADEAGLTVELEGMRALPVKGNLIGLLRERARNRTLDMRVILETSKTGEPGTAVIVSVRAKARRDLPIYEPGDDVGHDAPIGTLLQGESCWVHSGRVYGAISAKAGKGKVQLGGLVFGTRAVELTDDRAVHGLLTHDGEDDPIEAAPMFTTGGETLPVVGPLVGLLRERARNLRVTLQGERTPDGFLATAIRAVATRATQIMDDQPVGTLQAGDRVWVTGGRARVQQRSESKPEGSVPAASLRYGERPAPGVIDALRGDDD